MNIVCSFRLMVVRSSGDHGRHSFNNFQACLDGILAQHSRSVLKTDSNGPHPIKSMLLEGSHSTTCGPDPRMRVAVSPEDVQS